MRDSRGVIDFARIPIVAALVMMSFGFIIPVARGESTAPDARARSIAIADDVLDDTFTLQGVRGRQPRTAAGGLDWHHRGPRDDPEWAWMLNRHNYFIDLLAAWDATADPRYRDALRALVRDWIASNPYPGRMSFSAPWRALEVARRIHNSWVPVWFHRGPDGEPALDAATRELMRASIHDHADALYHHASFWGGNHLVTETAALAVIAAKFPDFAEASEWMRFARERTHRELFAQTYPDGSFKELTNHYQLIATRAFQRFLDVVDADPGEGQGDQSVGDAQLEAMRARVLAMWRYLAQVRRPDGTGPLNSASDLENNAAEALQQLGAAAQPAPYRIASVYFPWAGHCVMRNDYGPASDWAFFDIGPHGSAHQHHDPLHISLALRGRDFLVDAGRYTYQPGRWRDYFQGPHSHNLILLDGAACEPPPNTVDAPLLNDVRLVAEADFARARAWFAADAARGRGPVAHERSVVFVKEPRLWLVIDRIDAYGARTTTALWNFHPQWEQDAIAARMDVRALPVSAAAPAAGARIDLDRKWYRGQETPFIAGFRSIRYNEKEPAWQLRVSARIAGPTVFVWLFREPDESGAPARIRDLSIAPDRAMRVAIDNGEHAALEIRIASDGSLQTSILPQHE